MHCSTSICPLLLRFFLLFFNCFKLLCFILNPFPPLLSIFLSLSPSNSSLFYSSMDVYNVELLQYIRPDTMLSWTRARLSNQLASTGAEWAEIFSMYHSGTCTCLFNLVPSDYCYCIMMKLIVSIV